MSVAGFKLKDLWRESGFLNYPLVGYFRPVRLVIFCVKEAANYSKRSRRSSQTGRGSLLFASSRRKVAAALGSCAVEAPLKKSTRNQNNPKVDS